MTHSQPSPPIQRLVADLDAAARRRLPAVTSRARRLKLAVAVAVAILTSTAVAAATGSLRVFEATPDYKITESVDAPAGRICLNLRLSDPNRRGLGGCGEAPTAEQPFGMLIVDRESSDQSIVFGLVIESIRTVRMAGREIETQEREGVPGRFFSSKIADRPSVYAEGLDRSGAVITTIGSKTPSHAPITSLEQARTQGSFVGFAPGAADAPFTHNGATISAEQAQQAQFICTEDRTPTIRCTNP